MSEQQVIFDVAEAEFAARVVERSREVPVVVDFWAAWCGPCRQLGPALEAAVANRDGAVELAKVDVDANGSLAAGFDVRGIPAVKAFRDGAVVAEFTGALPPARIERFLDDLLPSDAARLAAPDDEASLRAALDADPAHAGAAVALARLLIARGDDGEARDLLEGLDGDFVASGLLARLRLCEGEVAGELEQAFSAWDDGEPAAALDRLQALVAGENDPERRDLLRQAMVAIFTELGAEHPLAREHRRRLATALN